MNEMLEKLKALTSNIERIDPCSESYKKMRSYIASLDENVLVEIRDAGIKFVSTLAGTELIIRNRSK